jgi:hypothetical protein
MCHELSVDEDNCKRKEKLQSGRWQHPSGRQLYAQSEEKQRMRLVVLSVTAKDAGFRAVALESELEISAGQ